MGFLKKIFSALLLVFVVAIGVTLIAFGGLTFASAFILLTFGSIALSGLGVFGRPSRKMEESTVVTRISEPLRWIAAGETRLGGAVLFGEFDTAGDLWVIVIHGDSILTDTVKYIVDDTEVTVDGSGWITTDEFCLGDDYEAYTSGTKYPYFRLWTTTYSESDPTPPAISALTTAIPEWTTDHKLVGTTYTVMQCKAVPLEHRHKVYKWRGPLGLGEPAVTIVGQWSNCYDPREVSHTLGTRTTYAPSRNPVLIWAWFRTHKFGRGKPESSINWTKVAEQATLCDATVVGAYTTQPRYQCDIAIPDDKERATAEQEILRSMDAQLMFDEDGKCWPRVGYYYSSTLTLSRNRDIIAFESVEAQNGESETQGVIVRYTDPDAKYTLQPAAPWYNPNYYVSGQSVDFLTIDIPACSNHNQAMRLAKAIGHREQPLHKIVPATGLRLLKAMQDRIVAINYDNTFTGDYEIVSPIELDQSGAFAGFGGVPVDANRWTLTSGEEKAKPVVDSTTNNVADPPDLTGVSVSFVDGKIRAEYDMGYGDYYSARFQYISDDELASDEWIDMSLGRLGTAWSGVVVQNLTYHIRYRTQTPGGVVSDWSTPLTLNASPLTLTGTPVTTGTVGVAYGGFTISASGGSTPYIFTDPFGALPDGITIDALAGSIAGTPTTAGTYSNIKILVQDAAGFTKYFATFTITVT